MGTEPIPIIEPRRKRDGVVPWTYIGPRTATFLKENEIEDARREENFRRRGPLGRRPENARTATEGEIGKNENAGLERPKKGGVRCVPI